MVRKMAAAVALMAVALSGCVTTRDVGSNAGASSQITEKYWKLVELRGQPVPTLDREPHIILKTDGNRLTGFGGCNTFMGSYKLDEERMRIDIGPVASTLMACSAGMDVERSFAEVLEQADNYSVNGDYMTLNRARMAPLARFEAVYLR